MKSWISTIISYLANFDLPRPIDMILYCPVCNHQHIDKPEPHADKIEPPELAWYNPPHFSHLCDNCSHIWRPADVPTNGVATIKTKGKHDDPRPLRWQ